MPSAGSTPSISIWIDIDSTVRISTMSPRISASSIEGFEVIVRMRSAATRISSPSRMAEDHRDHGEKRLDSLYQGSPPEKKVGVASIDGCHAHNLARLMRRADQYQPLDSECAQAPQGLL